MMHHKNTHGKGIVLHESSRTTLPSPICRLGSSITSLKGLCTLLVMGVMCMPVCADGLKLKINQKGQVGYTNAEGVEVVKCTYQSGTTFRNGVAKVGKGGKYGLIDETGKLIVPVSYTEIIEWKGSDLLRLQKGKVYGLADNKGNIIVDVKYSCISDLNCYGKAWIALGGKLYRNAQGKFAHFNAKWGVVDRTGKITITPKTKGLYEFAFDAAGTKPLGEGKRLMYTTHIQGDTLTTDAQYMGFCKKVGSIWNAGVIDSTDQIVVPEKEFKCVTRPMSGMVRYYKESKKTVSWGYYDIEKQQGFEVASKNGVFEGINIWSHTDFTGDIACVNGETWTIIDKSGNVIKTGFTKLKYGNTCGKWVLWDKNNLCEIIDINGKKVDALDGYSDINFRYSAQEPELYSVCKAGKWGVVDSEGREVVPFDYDLILGVRNNTIMTNVNNKYGMLKDNGESIVPNKYTDIVFNEQANPEYVWVKQSDGQYYNFNVAQQTISSQGYQSIENFTDGLAWVHPADIKVINDEVNRAQADLKEAPTPEDEKQFGYILRADNQLVFSKPLCYKYSEAIKNLIKKKGNEVMTENQMRKVLLKITATQRDYPMSTVIEEESWDY